MWRIQGRAAFSIPRSTVAVTSLALLMLATAPAAADAQATTRAAEIADAQQKKAEALHPFEPSAAERIAAEIKRRMLDTPNGFYPYPVTRQPPRR